MLYSSRLLQLLMFPVHLGWDLGCCYVPLVAQLLQQSIGFDKGFSFLQCRCSVLIDISHLWSKKLTHADLSTQQDILHRSRQ